MTLANLPWNEILRIFFATLSAFLCAFLLIPSINYIARSKGLLDKPGVRTSHRYATPNFGGISVFLAFSCSYMLFIDGQSIGIESYKYFTLSCLLIFFSGLKDDIMILSPEKKFLVQILVSLILIYGGFRITHLHGFLNMDSLSDIASVFLSLFIFLYIINSVNFIDGVDGLASGIGIVILLTFGFWFNRVGFVDWAVICFSFSGALFAFYLYNVFGLRNKTFMGDSGSMLLGLVIAVMLIKFNEISLDKTLPGSFLSAPAVSFGIVLIPVVDLLRVSIIRLLKKASPFSADRNHIHHRIMDMGFSHFEVSLILMGVNLGFIALSLFMRNSGIIVLGSVLLALSITLCILLEYLYNKKMKAKKQEPEKKQEPIQS